MTSQKKPNKAKKQNKKQNKKTPVSRLQLAGVLM